MKAGAKFIVLHHKPAGGAPPPSPSLRAWLLIFVLFFVFTFAFTLFTARDAARPPAVANSNSQLPKPVFDALVHYAALNASSASRMTAEELSAVAAVLRRCAPPCNLLVFGITHETLLWSSLNRNGRTVFVGDSAYMISKLEERHPSIEAYDVQFTTKLSELYDLMEYCKGEIRGECRPVQNLLFSDCKLAVNDMPNDLYDVAWDVIVVDGPRGCFGAAPGRMSVIFTAGVLARSKRGGAAETHVFVHEFDGEAERVCSEEFLCVENLVETKGILGHFVIGKMDDNSNGFGFCSVSASSTFPRNSI
ncbi:protein IRX15-LIKE-like [Salvia hispanica]|uniref:protein IRX15-LIKE-like n=1 Tax=Salvia hispanica TaxID=49212 RepID=UPI0020096525|nr:protein IRX15-LIKE-like [Salvia hispanica]